MSDIKNTEEELNQLRSTTNRLSQDMNEIKSSLSGLGKELRSTKKDLEDYNSSVEDVSENLLYSDKKLNFFKKTVKDFGTITKNVGKDIKNIIPSMGSFFGILNAAHIAGAITSMAKYEQSFKNLSYQLGQGNSKSTIFLKNIYKVKSITGDSLENLQSISEELIRNRVVGEKALFDLTKSASYFSEITGVSGENVAQLAGKLSRLGRLGPGSINNILTSIMRVQRAFGMTTEEVQALNEGIIETTTLLHNMGKNSSEIENFQKGTVKLAAAFASVGIEAKKATDLTDQLLDLDKIEENALMYSKLGISIQDAVAGNIDPETLQYRLKDLGKEIASMSRPAGYALARQLGTNYADIIKYQNMDPTKAMEGDKDLKSAAEEQRAFFTKVERFFSASLGKVAMLFLLSPNAFGQFIVSGLVYNIISAIAKSKARLEALGKDFGNSAGTAAANSVKGGLGSTLSAATSGAVNQEIKKGGIVSGMAKNQGVIPGSTPMTGSGRMAAVQRQLNQDLITEAGLSDRQKGLTDRLKTISDREKYLQETGQMGRLKQWRFNRLTKGVNAELTNANQSIGEIGQPSENLKTLWNRVPKWEQSQYLSGLQAEYKTLGTSRDKNYNEVKKINRLIEKLQKDIGRKTSKDGKPVLSEMERQGAQAKITELQQQRQGLFGERDAINKRRGQISKTFERLGDGYTVNGYQPLGPGAAPIEGEQGRLGKFFNKMGEKIGDPLKNFFSPNNFFGLKSIGGFLKNILKTLGPIGLGMMVVSQLMKHFQPLLDMMMPMLDSLFEVVAKVIAKPVKFIASILGLLINGIKWIIVQIHNLIPGLKKWEVPKLTEGVKEIASWQVGQKMDKKKEEEDAEKNGFVMEAQGGGKTVIDLNDAEDRKKFFKYWSGKKGWSDLTQKIDALIQNTSDQVALAHAALVGQDEYKKVLKEIKARRDLEISNEQVNADIIMSAGSGAM